MSVNINHAFLKDYISEFNRHKSSFILKPKLFRKQNAQTTLELEGIVEQQLSNAEAEANLRKSYPTSG